MRALLLCLLLLHGTASAITAQAYIAVASDGEVLLEKNADDVRPIASITKLLVAERAAQLDQNELITVTAEDVRAARPSAATPLRVGRSYTRRELTELALVSSDNVAAIALGRSLSPVLSDRAELTEASGLSSANQASARTIAAAALELHATPVGEVSVQQKTTVGARHSTNPLLNREGWVFHLSKTGFIRQAGGCLVVVLEVKDRLVTFVILGSANTRQRWDDLIQLRRQLGDTDFYVPVRVTKVKRTSKKR